MAENHDLVAADDLSAGDNADSLTSKSTISRDIFRQVVIILSLAISLVVIVYIFFLSKAPEMRPLGQYEPAELVHVLDILDAHKVEYTVDNTRAGGTVYVPIAEYQSILLTLNREGVDTAGASKNGNDLILKDSGFGVSQRLETERLKLSREQQLAALIEENQKISKATVLLAIPKDNVFARDKRSPSATVMLNIKGGTMLSQENVDSIVNIVASAVHDLSPSRVTVTDQFGRLLNSGSQDVASMASRKEFELQQRKEQEYKQKIDAILIPVLGVGKYTAEVDVALDFTREEHTSKTYNPDAATVRSEVTREDLNSAGAPGGVPGSLSNQPPASSQIPEDIKNVNNTGGAASSGVGGHVSREATRNYEIDTVISHKSKNYGGVAKLSVSVGIDYVSKGSEGSGSKVPLSDEELHKIRKLLEGGLGIDVTRGDTIEVVSVPFSEVPAVEAAEEVHVYEQDWFWRAFKILASVVLAVFVIVMIIKPMVMKLLNAQNKPEDEEAVDLDDSLALEGDDDLHLIAQSVEHGDSIYDVKNGQVVLPDIHKDEDVLRAVRALVANEPNLTAKVVKDWLEAEVK
ncbi:MAG: flagellar M-ring protein FliF [Succinivibrionaceae bacterium]|nr:flagellar M-ring protein FliF [Succinivibrionaceae bacterium]